MHYHLWNTVNFEDKKRIKENGENNMNETWHKILKRYIEDYEAIKTLYKSSILDEEETSRCEHTLLESIIDTFRSEIEE